jgi:hypothetical protein
MTGLDLESFLHLLRADFAAWASLGLIAGLIALMAWTSWGSRRALRKCLVLSVVAHVGLALYGGTVPVALLALQPNDPANAPRERIKQIKVAPKVEDRSEDPKNGRRNGSPAWDRSIEGLSLPDSKLTTPRASAPASIEPAPAARPALASATTQPESNPPAPASPETRAELESAPPTATEPAAPGADEVAPALVAGRAADADKGAGSSVPDRRIRPERSAPGVGIAETRRPPDAPALPSPPALEPSARPALDAARSTPEAIANDTVQTPAASERDVAPPEVVNALPEGATLSAPDSDLRAAARSPSRAATVPNGPSRSLATPLPNRPDLSSRTTEAAPDLRARTAPKPDATSEGAGSGMGALVDTEAPVVAVVPPTIAPLPNSAPADRDLRQRSRSTAANGLGPVSAPASSASLALNRVTPAGVPALPEIQGATGGRPLNDVPEVYRSRLDPNRSAIAYRAGASPESEQAVERALDWLARHQDTDGRWDGSTARYDDGTTVKGDDDYTIHCPLGEPCFGECIYWEADTALTGLALLAYLGAGYTQTDGKYAETVARGIDFLLLSQKPDGDLRGKSRAVGMYCHAMATIALCEAYALTGDEKLRDPVERAIAYIAKARARDGLAWRYAPGAPAGDTSILGWVVMALKSAREVGIAVPSSLQTGTIGWLTKVSTGAKGGLARYQPQESVTPTMTAEAWACRQFLGVGGPGPSSTEAAAFLLAHGPKSDQYNLYYWYYGTLAMYQHGGDAWFRWNAQVRDEIVRRQRPRGHAAGSWDPDDSPYGAKGGRIYCTALATLSLEVYYRYLRLYDDPQLPPSMAPRRIPSRNLGRAGAGPGGTR